MAKKKRIGLLVTTDSARRGVFFGYVDVKPKPGTTVVTLQQCRNAIYWSADVKGVFGLGVTGPTKDCKIGPPIPELSINGVTAIGLCTDAACEAWEKAPWK